MDQAKNYLKVLKKIKELEKEIKTSNHYLADSCRSDYNHLINDVLSTIKDKEDMQSIKNDINIIQTRLSMLEGTNYRIPQDKDYMPIVDWGPDLKLKNANEISINKLYLHADVYNILINKGIYTIADILNLPIGDIFKIKRLGRRGINSIRKALKKEYGIDWDPDKDLAKVTPRTDIPIAKRLC